jgi:hypothetical protein
MVDLLDPWDENAPHRIIPKEDRLPEAVWVEEWADSFTPGEWRTAQGVVYKIKDMSTDHLISAAAFTWRKGMHLRIAHPQSSSLLPLRKKLKELLAIVADRKDQI